MAKSSILSSSIAKKVAMALSGLFLISFLALHFFVNLLSVTSPETYNIYSHFMGNNGWVQFLLQPILIIGVVFHFVMGFVLEIQNRNARPIGYAKNNGTANSTWSSRNMIISGLVVLAFLGVHFYDFWFPEMVYKYVEVNPLDETRYYPELVHKFVSPVRTGLYCVSFLLLFLHLWHGFGSSFQSMGINNKFSPVINKLGYAFAIITSFGFIFIALYHHFNH
jgi:succinate dehydrogenase / fumarate reductase, cytochrome b subunit